MLLRVATNGHTAASRGVGSVGCDIANYKSQPTLCASRGKRLNPLGEPDQPRIGKPEIGEVAQGAGEIIAVGAAATGRACNDLRSLFQRQPPGVVWVITAYREGKCLHAATSSPHQQSSHIVNPGRCHFARPQGIDRLGHPFRRRAENYAATCAAPRPTVTPGRVRVPR